MIPTNTIICGRNEQILATFPPDCIDLTVTSPPYDSLRAYKGYEWDFDATARELWRVTKPGGVVVWVVGDATVNGSETGTSFRQALAFMALGFRLHDTMIWEKTGAGALGSTNCYGQNFEYVFIFSKGDVRAVNLIKDRKNVRPVGEVVKVNGSLDASKGYQSRTIVRQEYGVRSNIWRIPPQRDSDHDAPFPEKLAEDHILSWSNPGNVVLDPFVGSGTTPKMAIRHNRKFIGIDISPEYCDIARRRIAAVDVDMFAGAL